MYADMDPTLPIEIEKPDDVAMETEPDTSQLDANTMGSCDATDKPDNEVAMETSQPVPPTPTLPDVIPTDSTTAVGDMTSDTPGPVPQLRDGEESQSQSQVETPISTPAEKEDQPKKGPKRKRGAGLQDDPAGKRRSARVGSFFIMFATYQP